MTIDKAVLGCAGCMAFSCVALLFACAGLTALSALGVCCATRTPPLDMYDLMIDVSVFPQQWELGIGPVPPPEHIGSERGEMYFLSVIFCPEGSQHCSDGAQHAVFRYINEPAAARAFDSDFAERDFSNRYMVTPWTVPDEWTYESPVADRFKFACGEIEPFASVPRMRICTAVAQYEEYISEFTAKMAHMTLEDLERILIAIDDRMAFYLKEDTQ